jgi:hypothetical protein
MMSFVSLISNCQGKVVKIIPKWLLKNVNVLLIAPLHEGISPRENGQHQTPRGTEFVMLQAQPDDDMDKIVVLCEHLRLGVPQARGDMVVRVPSPLHSIEKLRDYMGY